MKILQYIQNDVAVNFNEVIRIAYCALNIESKQPIAIFTFEWITKNKKKSIQFYFVVLRMQGLKDSDSNVIIIL